MSSITYRDASADDADALAQLRYEMELERPAGETPLDREAFVAAHKDVTREWMARDGFLAWLAEADGVPVACVVLLHWRMPPNARALDRRRGLVTSVFTRREYRRQGIGHHLMELLIADARERGITRLVLWASQMGRPLYEDLGFTADRAMELDL